MKRGAALVSAPCSTAHFFRSAETQCPASNLLFFSVSAKSKAPQIGPNERPPFRTKPPPPLYLPYARALEGSLFSWSSHLYVAPQGSAKLCMIVGFLALRASKIITACFISVFDPPIFSIFVCLRCTPYKVLSASVCMHNARLCMHYARRACTVHSVHALDEIYGKNVHAQ